MSQQNSDNDTRGQREECLSAALDGDASTSALRQVLDGLASDVALRATAKRYQRIGSAIRRETPLLADVDLSVAVMAAIERDAQVSDRPVPHKRRTGWSDRLFDKMGIAPLVNHLLAHSRGIGQAALALSVTAVVIVGLQRYNTPTLVPTVADTQTTTTLTEPTRITTSRYAGSSHLAGYSPSQHTSITPEQLTYVHEATDQATRERFRAYAMQHVELTGLSAGQSALPFARLISFDGQ